MSDANIIPIRPGLEWNGETLEQRRLAEHARRKFNPTDPFCGFPAEPERKSRPDKIIDEGDGPWAA